MALENTQILDGDTYKLEITESAYHALNIRVDKDAATLKLRRYIIFHGPARLTLKPKQEKT